MSPRILTYRTVAECEAALAEARQESLELLSDLFEQRRQLRRYRRAVRLRRTRINKLMRAIEDRMRRADVMSDLIRSSPDGVSVPSGGGIEYVDMGQDLLGELGSLLSRTDPVDEESLRGFVDAITELRELAVDWFDYRGAKLVYELTKIVRAAGKSEDLDSARLAFERAETLRRRAGRWFS